MQPEKADDNYRSVGGGNCRDFPAGTSETIVEDSHPPNHPRAGHHLERSDHAVGEDQDEDAAGEAADEQRRHADNWNRGWRRCVHRNPHHHHLYRAIADERPELSQRAPDANADGSRKCPAELQDGADDLRSSALCCTKLRNAAPQNVFIVAAIAETKLLHHGTDASQRTAAAATAALLHLPGRQGLQIVKQSRVESVDCVTFTPS